MLVALPSSGDAPKDRDYRIRALTSQLQWQRGYNKHIINNFVSFYVENRTNVTLDWVGKGIFFEKMSVKKKPAQNWRKGVRRYKPVVQESKHQDGTCTTVTTADAATGCIGQL